MSQTAQRVMAWSGAAFVLLLFPGIVLTGLLPPTSPLKTAAEVAQFWSTNTGLKRCGLVVMLAASGLQVPLGALIATRIRQMGRQLTALVYVQLVGCSLAVVAILLPTFAFAAASYRPERDPQITQALNDLGWLPFVMNWPAATIQCLAIAFAIFGAKREIWPRWFGYWNMWCGFIFAAGGLVVLFKDGVFAWNGLLAFWLVAVFFGVWFLVMTWQLLATVTTPNNDQSVLAEDH
ncbi:hypothetical protein [Mycobacteroides abscessus]|uniref:hypothetical protein n=1 Tax=Mycobacteroides abscessus TaxID=36809 RepID=UPI0005E8FE6E|nr:hypothetical protein [Mycobacteroides abscessus]CPS43980.1 Uncharacterised protein [Mycobacteroides abscessus]CPS45799.1 Uncharacterised protein [Mycobacteroides abscessus]CPS54830.1 Uncharacterised protein [Mycobacteroides abscessus]CPT37771.1 Uncharacterised protein [Mycobacteroides abscessus]CPT64773.1 Uncharacterised protein [Mycobacteroides abscessus]